MAARVIIYDAAVSALFQAGGDVTEWNFRQAKEIETLAKAMAPRRTGALSASHGMSQNRSAMGRFQTGYRVFADAPYARYVHEGTGIYGPLGRPFTGRNGWMKIPGVNPNASEAGNRRGTVVRWVKGQRAQPWLRDAALAVL